MSVPSMSETSLPTADGELPENILQKQRFILYVKILFKHLSKADPLACERAKDIISDCTRRNRLGDPEYSPLMKAVDRRLRGEVQEADLRRAQMYMRHYLTKLKRGPQASSTLVQSGAVQCTPV